MKIKLLIYIILFSIFSAIPADDDCWTNEEINKISELNREKLPKKDREKIIKMIEKCPWLNREEATKQYKMQQASARLMNQISKMAEPLKFIGLALMLNNIYSLFKPFIEPYIQKHIGKFIFKNSIQPEQNNISFTSIAGYEVIKKQMRTIIKKIKKQKMSCVLEKIDGVLFYGAPGCGKTLFAESIANEAGVGFFNIKASDLINEEGNVGDRIKLLFEKIYAYTQNSGPCVLFIDEIDLLVPARNMGKLDNNEKIILQDLLSLLDGSKSLKGVLIIANTNFINAIDFALLRNGRLGTHIEFKLPTINDIEEICSFQIKKLNLKFDTNYSVREFATKLLGKNVAHIVQSIIDIKDFIIQNKYSNIINNDLIDCYEKEYIL
jgi:SpoVK/Ycf46/Vps4 family AAA+-type ATPase